MPSTMTLTTSNTSTPMGNPPNWNNGSSWVGSGTNLYQCSTCQQWYVGSHYCPGRPYNPNVQPWQDQTIKPKIEPGTPYAPTPKVVEKEVEVEVEVLVKICPSCEKTKRVDTEWNENDYICKSCRYGPTGIDDGDVE
jgi:hypothetical protein